MASGQELIDALNNCKDDCKNCVVSVKGKSCKEWQKAWQKMADKKHKEFGEKLRNDNQI